MTPAGRSIQKTDSFKAFEQTISRAEAFIRLFHGPAGRDRGQPSRDEKELLRGAVVFAVGAMDAYLHDLILEIVPQFSVTTRELRKGLKQIAKDDPGLALRVAIAGTAAKARDEFRKALGEWLSDRSFYGTNGVMRALLYLDIRIKQFGELSDLEDIADWFDGATKKRHNMVHRGMSPRINWRYAQSIADIVTDIGTTINGLVINKYYR